MVKNVRVTKKMGSQFREAANATEADEKITNGIDRFKSLEQLRSSTLPMCVPNANPANDVMVLMQNQCVALSILWREGVWERESKRLLAL